MAPVIPRAERHLHRWFAVHYPGVADAYTPERLHEVRHEVGERYPELRHDLSALRLRMLRQVFREAGYSEEPAAEAFAVFQAARNDVMLFDDVVPALRSLAATHRLFALTNGNASLEAIGISDCFEAIITARELGVAKPEPAFFTAALARAGLEAGESLHVGDHPENDIRAAQAVGMPTLWLNRKGHAWLLDDATPDHELDSLAALPELLQR